MNPDVEFLVRQSLAVRSVHDTHALLSRSLFDAPTRRAIDRVAATMDRARQAPTLAPLISDVENRRACGAMGSDALLKRQLETQQVPSWTAMTAHWQRHGAPSCAGALGA